jgi:hypothetical protein
LEPIVLEQMLSGIHRLFLTNNNRYGTMKDNVLNLTVVTPDGKIIKTAQRAKKSSAGLLFSPLEIQIF